MSDLKNFQKLVDDVWELVFGIKRNKSEELEYTNVSKGFTKEEVKDWKKYAMMKKPKRSRGKKGRYLADDPITKDVNEAWVGGKAPKKRGKK